MPLQTAYNITPAKAVAGMLADGDLESAVLEGRFPAAGNIPFGAAVEVVNGQCQVLQQTGTDLSKFRGIAVYQGMREQAFPAGSTAINAAYKAGEMVPVLRRGKIYALWDSGATNPPSSYPMGVTTIRLTHSSDGTHAQGTFTDATTSAAAGTEVTALVAGQGVMLGATDPAVSGVCLVELNLP